MLVKATSNKEASFTGRDGTAVLVKAGTVMGIRFNFGFGTVVRFADGTETDVSEPFDAVEKALGWDKAECAFKHDKVDRLFGVPFMPIEALPKICTCGAPITYADTVMFFPPPPRPDPRSRASSKLRKSPPRRRGPTPGSPVSRTWSRISNRGRRDAPSGTWPPSPISPPRSRPGKASRFPAGRRERWKLRRPGSTARPS